jgi:hypothetical protein
MEAFREALLDALMSGDITPKGAKYLMDCHRNNLVTLQTGFTETTEGYHTIIKCATLLGQNKKISALKEFRETFRVSLRGSKEAVEAIFYLVYPNGI